MSSTQKNSQPSDRKRKGGPLEQVQTNRSRKASDLQREITIPFLNSMLYDRLQQFPFAQHSQLLSSASGGNKNGGQQEDRSSHRDEPVFDFARLRNHAFNAQNPTGDACTDDEGIAGEIARSAVARQYASSGANNVPHNMFGEEDYFKDLGAFFNSADEPVQSGAIQPASSATGGDIAILPANVFSEDDHGDNPRPTSEDRSRATEPQKSKSKAAKSQSKAKKKQTQKSAPVTKKEIPLVDGEPDVEEERVMKNIREKKRRKGVSEKFKELYTLVCTNTKKPPTEPRVSRPNGRSSVKAGRVSKARMLEEAIRLIKNMECECSSLHSRNRFLEYQLQQFQQVPQDNTRLAKAASIVSPPIMPFSTHPVNPFLYMNMASLPSNPLPSRRQ